MKLFERVEVYNDFMPRPAAMNMAIDEALLESAAAPSIVSIAGSPLPFRLDTSVDLPMSLIRFLNAIWSVDGRVEEIVFHGEDLTYSIVIPADDPVFAESPMSIYENVHPRYARRWLRQDNAQL